MGSSPAATEAVGFGKYSLVARLATGGMAEIFLARLRGAAGFEKLVCIKRILPHLARDKHFVAMFLDEARIAARITHPNVCQVFELGEIEGSYYLAMEYLEGVPLSCFRRHDYYGALPDPRMVAGIAIQACEGLHHAHQLKSSDGRAMELVHRDVSPQNLFVTGDGIVKVLDFGIAKVQDATVRTSTGAVKGTYAYMAPEQLRGERVDRRIDVFALGIAMWETLTRRHLFKRDTEFLTFQAITGDPIEDVCALRPDVPAALSSVIMTALSRDRDARFPTARMMGEAIAAAIQPLTAPAISEEIARAFPAQLAEQAELIRVARSGGAFALDADRGPSVGHGTDLMTTPVSGQSRSSSGGASGVDLSSISGISGISIISSRSASPPSGAMAPDLATKSLRSMAGGASLQRPRHDTVHDAPSTTARPVRRRRWQVLALLLALVAGGGAVLLYMRFSGQDRDHNEGNSGVVAIAPANPGSTSAGSASAGSGNAASANAGSANAGSANAASANAGSANAASTTARSANASANASAAGQTSMSQDAAQRDDARREDGRRPSGAAGGTAPSDARPASTGKPRAQRPSGPPGFITIDSQPWATIYIDGKDYGPTPVGNVALPPGRHGVRAVTPSGTTKDFSIWIESGKTSPPKRVEW